jgi:NH3-dependent NAD+ synthetase
MMLLLGIRDYFGENGISKAVLGSSGESTVRVTLTMACKALGAENVRAVAMPSSYSSGHSVMMPKHSPIRLKNLSTFCPSSRYLTVCSIP